MQRRKSGRLILEPGPRAASTCPRCEAREIGTLVVEHLARQLYEASVEVGTEGSLDWSLLRENYERFAIALLRRIVGEADAGGEDRR